jgi:hypothetical protein
MIVDYSVPVIGGRADFRREVRRNKKLRCPPQNNERFFQKQNRGIIRAHIFGSQTQGLTQGLLPYLLYNRGMNTG